MHHPAEESGRSSRRAVIAYYGHHKCASRWITAILARVVAEAGLTHTVVVDELTPESRGPLTDYATTFDRNALRDRVDEIGADVVSCMTADKLQADVLQASRAFHVIRDPRDIVVSAYFSHRNSHPVDGLPHMQRHREALLNASVEEGLLLEMEFSKAELLELADWDYDTDAILEVRMEELTEHPYDGFIRIFRHLGVLRDDEPLRAKVQGRIWLGRILNRISWRHHALAPLRQRLPATGELVLGTVYANRFEVLTSGRRAGVEDSNSHYRKGVQGDWKNYFSALHLEAFESHFGDLLERLGYDPVE